MDEVRVLVVDDEPLARQRLRRFLGQRSENLSVREAADGVSAIEAIGAEVPQLVFLDIAMPGLTGFEVLQQLPRRDFVVVFQTAHDDFAIRAFEENACDYLLKPFGAERFHRAMDRALKHVGRPPSLEPLGRYVRAADRYLTRLVVRTRRGIRSLETSEVLYCVSRDHYTHVGTHEGEFLCDLPLAALEERLSPTTFRRVHRSSIVRLDAIVELLRGEPMRLRLVNGAEMPVARERRREVRRDCLSVLMGPQPPSRS